MSEYRNDSVDSDHEGARAIAVGVTIAAILGASFAGANYLLQGSDDAHATQEAPKKPHKKDAQTFQMRAGRQTLKCSIAADIYTVKPGDNLWNIVRARTDDYQDASHIGSQFIYEWHGTIGLNQQEDRVGDNPDLIYPHDRLKTLEDCSLQEPDKSQ